MSDISSHFYDPRSRIGWSVTWPTSTILDHALVGLWLDLLLRSSITHWLVCDLTYFYDPRSRIGWSVTWPTSTVLDHALVGLWLDLLLRSSITHWLVCDLTYFYGPRSRIGWSVTWPTSTILDHALVGLWLDLLLRSSITHWLVCDLTYFYDPRSRIGWSVTWPTSTILDHALVGLWLDLVRSGSKRRSFDLAIDSWGNLSTNSVHIVIVTCLNAFQRSWVAVGINRSARAEVYSALSGLKDCILWQILLLNLFNVFFSWRFWHFVIKHFVALKSQLLENG